MPAQDTPTPNSEPAQPHSEAAVTGAPQGDPATSPDLPTVDPSTRLVLARLASGTSQLLEVPRQAAPRAAATGPLASVRTRVTEFGSILFPPVGGPGGRGVGRMELAAFGVALVGATVIGVSLPHPQQVQASPVVVATAPPAAVVPVAVAATPAPAADDAAAADDPAADASASDDLATATVADTTTSDAAMPAASDEGDVADDTASGDADEGAASDPDDPLGAGKAGTLKQVALVVVHGDAPLRWRDAPAGSPARLRAAKGTTFTGFGQVPDAPLVTSLGLIAGQGSNPAARAGCDVPTPVTPGTVDAKGIVAGTGCDFPAGTPSVPTAVAVDGRRWKAYAPVATVDAAKAALCGVGTPDAAAQGLARESALAHLSDLSSSGACEAAASPLSNLAKDLTADDAPAWLVVNVGLCGTDGCDDAEAAARDKDLDGALATLTAKKGLDASSAIFVVGDATGVTGLAPAEPGTVQAAPVDPDAPAAVASGALLIGSAVTKDKTDPLSLDPFAIARAQTTWLGLTAPGAAASETTTALALPGA